jgi:transcriptional regulator with XRE-family HTH domain
MITVMGATRIPTFSGALLRTARESQGWSRGRLAVALGKTVTSVAGWERGLRNPAPSTLVALAKALGLSPGDFLEIPRSEWSLVELRVTSGLEQKDVAEQTGIPPAVLSQIEATYERLPNDDRVAAMANLYGSTPAELNQAWERARKRLTSS